MFPGTSDSAVYQQISESVIWFGLFGIWYGEFSKKKIAYVTSISKNMIMFSNIFVYITLLLHTLL